MQKAMFIGVGGSVLFHAVLLFGFNRTEEAGPVVAAKKVDMIQMEMPPLEQEKDETVAELAEEVEQLAPPTLIDLPTVVPVNAFTQQIQPPPPPGIKTSSTLSIPVTRSAALGEGMKDVFDLANLDQAPVPKFQSKPVYPVEMLRAKVSGEVVVAFIVSATGDVVEATALKSTAQEFENPAVQAVLKWKFRPGRKGNRTVNTKMIVPIGFEHSRG